MIKVNIFALKSKSENEAYDFVDKYLKKLPRNSDGTYDLSSGDFYDNDVDAIRHAYTSGVFTQEYGARVTEILGELNELIPLGNNSSSNSKNSKTMDSWNNAIGRKLGLKTTGKIKLFKLVLKALQSGELIIDPENDPRINALLETTFNTKNKVFVIKESKRGRNLAYFDFEKLLILTKQEFIIEIQNGNYPNYDIKRIKGAETPVSKSDKIISNNLG